MPATNSILALAASTTPKDKEEDDKEEQGGEKMTPALLRRLALAHDGTGLLHFETLIVRTPIPNSPFSVLSPISFIWWQ
jgi:hypothetical protein